MTAIILPRCIHEVVKQVHGGRFILSAVKQVACEHTLQRGSPDGTLMAMESRHGRLWRRLPVELNSPAQRPRELLAHCLLALVDSVSAELPLAHGGGTLILGVKYSVEIQLLDIFASQRMVLWLWAQYLVLGLVICRMRHLLVHAIFTIDYIVAFAARDRLEARHVALPIELQRLIVAEQALA